MLILTVHINIQNSIKKDQLGKLGENRTGDKSH